MCRTTTTGSRDDIWDAKHKKGNVNTASDIIVDETYYRYIAAGVCVCMILCAQVCTIYILSFKEGKLEKD